MTDIEQRIEQEVAFNLRTHALKQAHERLATARSQMRMAERLLEAEENPTPDAFADDIEGVVVNGLEPIMWRLESEVRARQQAVK